MDTSNWKQIEQIFNEAVLIAPGERHVFVRQRCADQPNLYQQVLSLLVADNKPSEILEQPVLSLIAPLLEESTERILEKSDFASYKLQIVLGRGGMGTVFLAEDKKLERSVAIKVLSSAVSENSMMALRFQQEAKAASAISHPNVAHIYEYGRFQGMYFLAMEYIRGKTLRALLQEKNIDLLSAINIILQVCYALGAAHKEHIIHRDIKPENIMINEEDLVKVVDFGIAKLSDKTEKKRTISLETTPGMLLGTAAYMSPEQIRGVAVDERTDLWNIGIVFYELLEGKHPFEGETQSDTQAAILLKNPTPPAIASKIPLIGKIIHKALSKDFSARYRTAKELVSDLLTAQRKAYDYSYKIQKKNVEPTSEKKARLNDLKLKKNGNITGQIKQLTFQQGFIQSAKFSADGQRIIYSAAWEGNDSHLYSIDKENKQSETIERGLDVLAVFPTGEIAAASNRVFLRGYVSESALIYLDQTKTSSIEIIKGVQAADAFPGENCPTVSKDSKCFVIVREVEGKNRLEYPIGNVLYETGGWISNPRFSPKGDKIAFIDHSTLTDDSGEICFVNLKGKKQSLSSGWISAQGLAWTPDGKRIRFTGAKEGNARAIYEVSLTGKEKFVYQSIGSLTLHDVSADGQMLVTIDKTRIRINVRPAGETEDFDLSWHDWSLVRDISPDGKTILFTEAGESGGSSYATYIRKTDGTSLAQWVSEGSSLAFSPDGKIALVRLLNNLPQIAVVCLESGENKFLKNNQSNSLFYQPWACWFPDGRKILFSANEKDKGTKLYVQDIDGEPECITPHIEGIEISSPHSISPDGKFIAVSSPDRKVCLLPCRGEELSILPNVEPGYVPIRWSADGQFLFLRMRGKVPAEIYRYGVANGELTRMFEIGPIDKTGVHEILRILLTPDLSSYAYSYTRELSDLFVINNL